MSSASSSGVVHPPERAVPEWGQMSRSARNVPSGLRVTTTAIPSTSTRLSSPERARRLRRDRASRGEARERGERVAVADPVAELVGQAVEDARPPSRRRSAGSQSRTCRTARCPDISISCANSRARHVADRLGRDPHVVTDVVARQALHPGHIGAHLAVLLVQTQHEPGHPADALSRKTSFSSGRHRRRR